MKKFYCCLREHATNVISFEKKKMLPSTKNELKPHQDAIVWYRWRKRFSKKLVNDEKLPF